ILNTQLFKNDWTSGMAATGTGNFNNWTDCATASPTGTLHVVMTYTAGTDTVHLKLTMGGTTVYDISLTQAGAGAAMNKAACLIISNDVGGASKTTVGNAFVLNAPPRTGGSTVTGQTLPIAIVALCTLSASAVGVVMLRARKQRDDA
ncbi:MAG: hypothetical protein FWF49_04320, partial [Oscillospiraceae bacterium]|nr:hypothetical protein [Oscillospiraceae bacterium]